MTLPERYDRNMRLFGAEGQRKLRSTKATVVGVSGLGTPLVQQLALLGLGEIALVDDEELEETNRNRFVGAKNADPIPGSHKVDLAARHIREIDPSVACKPIPKNLLSPEAFDAVKDANWVFGCVDDDGPRAVLNELAAAYEKPYIDLASDVPDGGSYGGRILVAHDGRACLECLNLLDRDEVRRYFMLPEEKREHDRIYGIARSVLDGKGPSVAPLNAVIAGLAAMEFMVTVTGMRAPARWLEYRGQVSKVVLVVDPPRPDCPVCKGVRGTGVRADVERYLRVRNRV